MSVIRAFGRAATIGFGRREWIPSLPEPSPANASADLISFLQASPEGRMRRRMRFPQWFLPLVGAGQAGQPAGVKTTGLKPPIACAI